MAIYFVTGNATSVASAANTELLQGLATSSGGFRLKRLKIGQITTETATGIVWQINKVTGAFTAGSGGTAITPANQITNFGTARSTWLQLNTTAITGGTKTTLANFVMQDVIGDEEVPLPDELCWFMQNEALQILLVTALGATTNLAYRLSIEE